MSLLAKQRSAIVNDISKKGTFPVPPEDSDNGDESDGLADFDGEFQAETTLFKSHLRRLRNFYVVLAEVCQRDYKLLGF